MKMHRWLTAVFDAVEDETLALPWSRGAGRRQRKAAARARATAA